MSNNRPILLVDAYNVFIRAYSAFPTMSAHGHQMGGTIGFLRMLARITDEIKPSAIYIAWEGGGSTKRRAIFSEYKMNRKPERLNRFYEDDIPDSEDNKKHQILTLLRLMKNIPVCQVYVSDCEGDDIIAYLCRGRFRNDEKIIISSDKDMYQLLNDTTTQYSLHRKTYVTQQTVLKEFRITSHNFAIAKAICGDSGDNVPGVKGIGWKKVVKLFPFLGSEEDVLLQTIFDYSRSHLKDSTLYKRILDNENEIKRNWRLVYLDGGMLTSEKGDKIDHMISTFNPTINKMGLMRCLYDEGIGDFNSDVFFSAFNCINNVNYNH